MKWILLVLLIFFMMDPRLLFSAESVKSHPSSSIFQSTGSRKGQAMTLEEAYQLALKRSETVAISEEALNQARARSMQALGTALPQLSFLAKEVLQEKTSAAGFTNSNSMSRTELALRLNQPLFQGFREFNALKASRAGEAQQQHRIAEAKRLLLKDVATAYYVITHAQWQKNTHQKILSVLKSQLAELNERIRLGKSRESERLAQEASISLLEADLEKDQGDLRVGYEILSFLTGLNPQPPIAMKDPLSEKIPSLDFFVQKIHQRPDVLAAQQAIALSQAQVRHDRGALLPRLDLEANLYPYREGTQKEVNWDTTLQLQVPIFQWGNYGTLKESKSKLKQSEIQAVQADRVAEKEVRESYAQFQSSFRQYQKYRTATQKAEASYRQQVSDFKFDLINNLQVLQSQQTWLNALQLYDQARIKAWADWVVLQISAGGSL